METVAELKHFYFAYKKNNLVLHDIDFKIEKGSFTVIAGPSGSGKTTLCKAMAGIVPFYMGGAYSGEVMVLGESTKGKKVSDIAMRLGLMLEDYESQLVSLTAGEEVAFSLLNHGFKPEEVEERTRRALEDVGLPGRESYQLEIIVLDEPVSAMDPDGANSLYKLLYKIHKEYGTTIVVVEHRIDYLLPYMTDLVVLKKGRLVAADKFENAARVMYKDETLRHFVPALWRIKLGLEEKFGVSLGNWRTEEEAVAELKAKGFTGGEA